MTAEVESVVMRSWFLSFLLVMACASVVVAGEAPVLLVFGDSLSASHGIDPRQGWVTLLQRRLADNAYDHRVVNASLSGDTTRGGLERLPQALHQHRPALVLIELGANDGLRGFPLAETRRHLTEMVALARAAGARVLLFAMRLPDNYGRRYTEPFAELFPEVAEATHVPLLPFFLDGVVQRPDWMQDDNLHPNAAAQPRLLDNVWPVLQPLL
jgi:acyl-CoA thioesterase I